MKNFKTSLCFSLLLIGGLLVGHSAQASDTSGRYMGQGAPICSSYLQEQTRDSMAYYSMSGWVAGYLTAYNQFTHNTYDILGNLDFDGVLLWIKNYCEKNPQDSAAAALKNLTPELYPRRTVKAP